MRKEKERRRARAGRGCVRCITEADGIVPCAGAYPDYYGRQCTMGVKRTQWDATVSPDCITLALRCGQRTGSGVPGR